MYSSQNTIITISYDEEIISKLKEMLEEGGQKLKSFVKAKKEILHSNQNLDFYNDLKDEFKNIALKLKELNLFEELRYFLSVSHMINYIVYKNSIDSSFGYCGFAVELLEFYLDMFQTNVDGHEFDVESQSKRKYCQYARKFYWDICNPDDDFATEEMHEFGKNLMEYFTYENQIINTEDIFYVIVHQFILNSVIPNHEELASCNVSYEDLAGNPEILYSIKFKGDLSFSKWDGLHYIVREEISNFCDLLGFPFVPYEITVFLTQMR